MLTTVNSPMQLEEYQSGFVITNKSADNVVHVFLPPGKHGLKFTFVVREPQIFKISASGADKINLLGETGSAVYANELNAVLSLFCIQDGVWIADRQWVGAWTVV